MKDINSNSIQVQIQQKVMDELTNINKILNDEINARKISEAALKESEERYRQIVEEAHDIIYRTDKKGFITYINKVAQVLTGIHEKDNIGKHYSELIREDNRKQAVQFYQKIFKKGVKSSFYELPLRTDYNRILWVEQNVIMLKDNNGKVIGFQAVARDITERKIIKEKLLEAKEEAEEAAKVKSKFLANMSHEIRTPMNGILGLTKLLQKTSLTKKQQDYLSAIATSSDTLLVIINDILDISKIEAGKMSFEKKPFKVINLITSVIDFFQGKAAEKKIQLNCITDEHLPEFAIGDAIRLNQILYNLLGNAIKFTDKGEVNLFVNVLKKDTHRITIKFAVQDTGIGVPLKKQSLIFNAFTQVDGDTTKKYGGTGLGLEIVKKLVEEQGGTIDLQSKLNKGSTFTFTLTFGMLNRKSNQDKEGESILEEATPDIKNTKVLLVEDNPVNQLVAIDLLEEEGVIVDVANNGKEAIYMLKDNNYHIILMDVQMPVMDGYLAMDFIRTRMQPPKQSTPILALTAHAVKEEIEKCKNAGANDYLSKPFQPNELFKKIALLATYNNNIHSILT